MKLNCVVFVWPMHDNYVQVLQNFKRIFELLSCVL